MIPSSSRSATLDDLLTWRDVSRICNCGRSKALKIVHQLGPIYVGRQPLLPEERLRDALQAGIKIDWR